MLRAIIIYFIVLTVTFTLNAQNCPDDINNSPGGSGSTAEAIVYNSDGSVFQTISCDQTGGSGQIDCNLDSLSLPAGAYVSIEIGNGNNATTCFYDANGEHIDNIIELPVDFAGLNVENNEGVNELSWATYSERNNSFFEIEYSSNGIDWNQFEKVDGAGNSTTEINYKTEHSDFKSGVNYYRISQYDIDGKNQLLETVSIENKIDFDVTYNEGEVKIYSDNEIQDAQCYDLNGKVVQQNMISEDKHKAVISLSKNNSGFYIVNVVFFDGSMERRKVFVG